MRFLTKEEVLYLEKIKKHRDRFCFWSIVVFGLAFVVLMIFTCIGQLGVNVYLFIVADIGTFGLFSTAIAAYKHCNRILKAGKYVD